MKSWILVICLGMFSYFSGPINASPVHTKEAKPVEVQLFLSSKCPHCVAANEFFTQLEKNNDWLQVSRYYIDKERSSLVAFNQTLVKSGSANFAVPALFFCGSHWVGFSKDLKHQKVLIDALEYCHQQMLRHGTIPQATTDVLQRKAFANMLNLGTDTEPSFFTMLVSSSLSDSLNFCAVFFLFFFVVFITCLTKKLGRSVFLVWLLGIGVLHFFLQATPVIMATVLLYVPWVARVWGLVMVGVLFWFFKNRTIRIAREEKKDIRGLAPMLLIHGWFLYLLEQSCATNIALLFPNWMQGTGVSLLSFVALTILYQVMYLIPYLVIWFLLKGLARLPKSYSRLYYSSWIFIVVTGLYFIIAPGLLIHLWVSMASVLFALIIGAILARFNHRSEA